VRLANGGYTLNRGYWNEKTKNPLQAQLQLCELIGEFARFSTAKTLLDLGGGSAAPSLTWKSIYRYLDVICLDLNYDQLSKSRNNPDTSDLLHPPNSQASITSINGTANLLPFADHSIDRIVALESHHHFIPLNLFIGESKRVLESNGLLIIASPIKVTDTNFVEDFLKLGFLSLTLQSKNYLLKYLKSVLAAFGFQIKNILHIGSYVFRPLADYYIHNRREIKQRVTMGYPLFIEKLLYNMVLKSVYAYNKGMIDYLLINCSLM
jgi:ubiquinone/menaquinone biosynthesis C-methylase UbiE